MTPRYAVCVFTTRITFLHVALHVFSISQLAPKGEARPSLRALSGHFQVTSFPFQKLLESVPSSHRMPSRSSPLLQYILPYVSRILFASQSKAVTQLLKGWVSCSAEFGAALLVLQSKQKDIMHLARSMGVGRDDGRRWDRFWSGGWRRDPSYYYYCYYSLQLTLDPTHSSPADSFDVGLSSLT